MSGNAPAKPSALTTIRVASTSSTTPSRCATTQTPEALHRLVESYLSLGLTDEAQTAGAILGFNFQSTDWYEDSFALLTGRGLRPEATGDNWLRQVYRQTVRGEWL